MCALANRVLPQLVVHLFTFNMLIYQLELPSVFLRAKATCAAQEPTAAATEAGMQALVVSAETIRGAEEIQGQRAERGFAPLAIVVVDLVPATRALAGGKLSSTALRDAEAARLAKQQHVPGSGGCDS